MDRNKIRGNAPNTVRLKDSYICTKKTPRKKPLLTKLGALVSQQRFPMCISGVYLPLPLPFALDLDSGSFLSSAGG